MSEMVPRSKFDSVDEQLRQVVAFMQRQFGMTMDGAGLSQPPPPPPPPHEQLELQTDPADPPQQQDNETRTNCHELEGRQVSRLPARSQLGLSLPIFRHRVATGDTPRDVYECEMRVEGDVVRLITFSFLKVVNIVNKDEQMVSRSSRSDTYFELSVPTKRHKRWILGVAWPRMSVDPLMADHVVLQTQFEPE
ncbi:hypothetical protein Scep_006958 [Stephania cephalantha]|uniref:Uncharacterized protein n=1 Tax=Stephania cephalantha TaxID=152367 RepID=A0AAP0K954_9MAGN